MVDARMPEKYLVDRRVLRLSAETFRAFSMLTMWSVSNRTDGRIAVDDLPLIPFVTDVNAAELVKAGLAVAVDDGWLLTDFQSTQTSSGELEILENNRRRERLKKQRQRGTVPRDVPRDVSPGTAQDRQGKDRQGKEGPPQADISATEPSGFCSKHPAGSGGVSCGPCADARRVREMWKQAQVKPTPVPPRRAEAVAKHCAEHDYPIAPTCAACDRAKEEASNAA